MRSELKEYNYDWMLWRIMNPAHRTAHSSEKEIEYLYRYMPYFKNTLEMITCHGEVGTSLLALLDQYLENLVTARSKGKKIAITTFCFSPVICYALDVIPVTLEVMTAIGGLMLKRGTYDYLDYAVEAGFTETSCSAQRGSLGAYLAGLGEEIDMVICDTPGVCDTNANAFAFAAAYLNKPFYQLNYPQGIGDDRTEKYHVDDYKALIEFMETHSGNTLDIDRLREILDEVDKQDELIADIEEMHRFVPDPIPPIFNLFNYVGRFLFSGKPEYTRVLKEMVACCRENAAGGKSGLHSGKENLRAFFCYIDHYSLNWELWRWLDEKGISHLGGIISLGFRDNAAYRDVLSASTYSIDKKNLDTMIQSIAQMNSRLPMVRSIRGPYDQPNMWLDESLEIAKLFQADCMIYNATPGCRNTWGMVKPFAMDVEQNGYPAHIMYSDAFDDRTESWEQTKGRLEEFCRCAGYYNVKNSSIMEAGYIMYHNKEIENGYSRM